MRGLQAGVLGTMKSCRFPRVFLWRFISWCLLLPCGPQGGREPAFRLLCEGPPSAFRMGSILWRWLSLYICGCRSQEGSGGGGRQSWGGSPRAHGVPALWGGGQVGGKGKSYEDCDHREVVLVLCPLQQEAGVKYNPAIVKPSSMDGRAGRESPSTCVALAPVLVSSCLQKHGSRVRTSGRAGARGRQRAASPAPPGFTFGGSFTST